MTSDRTLFVGVVKECSLPVKGIGGVRGAVMVTAVGSGEIIIDGCVIGLSRLFYVPLLDRTLISASELVEDGHSIQLHKVQHANTLTVTMPDGRSTSITATYGLYAVDGDKQFDNARWVGEVSEEGGNVFGYVSVGGVQIGNTYVGATSLGDILHQRCGHISWATEPHARRMRSVFGKDVGKGCGTAACDACARAKIKRKYSRSSPSRPATRPLQRVHFDMSPKVPEVGAGGATGFLVVVDEFTGWDRVYMLSSKTQVPELLKEFKAEAEKHFATKMEGLAAPHMLAGLRSDGEIVNVQACVREWCKEHGIRHEVSAPYSQDQDGIVERLIETLWQGSEAMRKSAGAPAAYWPYSLRAFSFIKKRLALGASDKCPWELWNQVEVPLADRIKAFRTWGCKAYVLIPAALRKKLDDKARVCVFLGYSDRSKAYLCQDLETMRIYVSTSVLFDETCRPLETAAAWGYLAKDTADLDQAMVHAWVQQADVFGASDTAVLPDGVSAAMHEQGYGSDAAPAAVAFAPVVVFSSGVDSDTSVDADGVNDDVKHDDDDRPTCDYDSDGDDDAYATSREEDSDDDEDSGSGSSDASPASASPSSSSEGATDGDSSSASRGGTPDDGSSSSEGGGAPGGDGTSSGAGGASDASSSGSTSSSSSGSASPSSHSARRNRERVARAQARKLPAVGRPRVRQQAAMRGLRHWVPPVPGHEHHTRFSKLVRDVHTHVAANLEGHKAAMRTETERAASYNMDGAPSVPAYSFSDGQTHLHAASRLQDESMNNAVRAKLEARISLIELAAKAPKNFNEAVVGVNAKAWWDAMGSEFDSMHSFGSWKLVQAPPGARVHGCRWVFAIKRDALGGIKKLKARLVARGNTMQHGVDYDESWSPTCRLRSFRYQMAEASADPKIQLRAMDATNAYLHAEMDTEVYMRQPQGFARGTPGQVCKLLKAVYGCPQSGRLWFKKLRATIMSAAPALGVTVTQGKADECLFVIRRGDSWVKALLHVDDESCSFNDETLYNEFLKHLQRDLDISDEPLTHYLGLGVRRDATGVVHLSQTGYIDEVLQRFGLSSATDAWSPEATGTKAKLVPISDPLTAAESAFMAKVPYAEAVGALHYVTRATRPDIAHAVGQVARFVANPSPTHWLALVRVWRYLKRTRSAELSMASSAEFKDMPPWALGSTLDGLCDADWAGCSETRRSHTGWMVRAAGATMAWMSRRQENITMSTTEAEIVALSDLGNELAWWRLLAADFGHTIVKPIVIKCDNSSTVKLSKHSGNFAATKHIQLKHLKIRERTADGEVQVQWVPAEEQTADILTKNAAVKHFRRLASLMLGCTV